MSIKYSLFPNRLTENGNDFAARVQLTGSVDLSGLAQRIINQGSTVTMPDVLAVLENTIQAVEGYLLDGFRVNLGGLCDLYPRVRGTFAGLTDGYDPARHRVELGARPGSRLLRRFRDQAGVTRTEPTRPVPVLLNFEDVATGASDSVITGGNIGIINGHRLGFDASQSDEGVFLIDLADGAVIKVDQVQKNKPSQLVFLVPSALPSATTLALEVRARFGAELRRGRLTAELQT